MSNEAIFSFLSLRFTRLRLHIDYVVAAMVGFVLSVRAAQVPGDQRPGRYEL